MAEPDTVGGATRAAQDAVEAAAKATQLDPSELMTRALIAAALAPQINLIPQMVPSPDGRGMHQTFTPMHGPSPMAEMGRALWEDRKAEVMAAVAEQVRPEAVAEVIAGHVTRELTRVRGRFEDLHPDAVKVQAMVREQLAATLSDRAMAAWDERQAAMEAAYEREQARERQAAVAQGDGVEGIPAVGNDAAADAGDGRY